MCSAHHTAHRLHLLGQFLPQLKVTSQSHLQLDISVLFPVMPKWKKQVEEIQCDFYECLSNAILKHQCLELFRVLGTQAAAHNEGANVWALDGNGG